MMRLLGPSLACLLFSASLSAGDWPQILGPNRNGDAENEKLADSWPDAGPKMLWSQPVGSGFAGVAVAGDRLVLFHRTDKDHEEVLVLNSINGQKIWSKDDETSYSGAIVEDNGPRCVPIIHDDKVIVHGAEGIVQCFSLKDGSRLWRRDTHRDYQAPSGYFGAGSSPIVVDGQVILNVGGAKTSAGVVSFSIKDGSTLWKSTSELASYSSPVVATIDDVAHLICITRLKAISLNPADGEVRFSIPFGNRGPTVNGANPVVIGNKLFLTASYGIGAVYGEIQPDALDVAWTSDEILSSQYTTSVQDDGLLYGVHGRQDAGVAALRCIDPKSKEVRWEQPDFGYATLIKGDGKILALKTDGELVLIKLDGQSYQELKRARIFNSETRSLPALSNGRFYARDTQTLKCIDVGKR